MSSGAKGEPPYIGEDRLTRLIQITVVCITIIVLGGAFAWAYVEGQRIEAEAETIKARQQIEHDETRPRKLWERGAKQGADEGER